MNNSHETDHAPMYPALSMMERHHPPMKYSRGPFWRPEIPAPTQHVYIPDWNWTSVHDIPEDCRVLNLDTNGMYLAALSSASIGMSHLRQTGGCDYVPDRRKLAPGYYRIMVPHWAFDGTIVSPLGNSPRLAGKRDIWVAAPTVFLLIELYEQGAIADVTITDSWTAEVASTFKDWAAHLRSVREARLASITHAKTDAARTAMREEYDAFKEGYSAALSMMLTGEKCKTRRPDWAHTIQAKATTDQWRKAWNWTLGGRPLLAMGAKDEISVFSTDLPPAMSAPKPPFRVDETGLALGAFKTKSIAAPTLRTQRTTHTPLALLDDEDGDIL